MKKEAIYSMLFSRVYPLLIDKAQKKGRSREEVLLVTAWLTGYTQDDIEGFLDTDLSYGDFFRQAPRPSPHKSLITGTVCGVRVEDISDPLMRDIRCLDKLVDELAKGKAMEKILREPHSVS